MDKINDTTNALFFFCELQLIIVLLLVRDSYTSWNTRFMGNCVGFSILVFIKVYISVQPKTLTLKRHNSFQKKYNINTTRSFTPKLLVFKLQHEVWNSLISAWVGAPQKRPGDEIFKLGKPKFWVCHLFSIVTFKKYLTFPYLITYLFLLLTYFFNFKKTSIKKLY